MSFLISLIKPLAYASFPFLILRRVASRPTPSPHRYYARWAIFLTSLLILGCCGAVAAVGLCILGHSNDVNYYNARLLAHLLSPWLDVKVEVEGAEFLQTRPAVHMANHQSILDLIVLATVFPKKTVIMAKSSVKYTPIGPWMAMAGNIFVNRSNSAGAIRSLEAAGELMQKRRISLWMFPEGTRHMSETPNMLPFKKGGFHLAINAGLPIVPVVISNYWALCHKGVFETGVIKVKVLPPIPTTSMTTADIHTAMAQVRELMLETLRDPSLKVLPASEKTASPDPPAVSGEPASSSLSETQPASTPTIDSVVAGSTPPPPPPPPSIDVVPTPVADAADPISPISTPSLSSSSISVKRNKEDGAETEEDEGMVLVGRPQNS